MEDALCSLTILRLPPGLLAMRFEGGDDILNAVTHGVGIRIVRSPRITVETLLLFLNKGKGQKWKGLVLQYQHLHIKVCV